jgi:hypothetical protein
MNNLANSITIKSNSKDSFQSTPAWSLCFLSFRVPSPINASEQISDPTAIKDAFFVTSDCISLSVSQSKSNHNPSFEAVLLSGEYNYLAKVNPGDYVLIHMADREDKIGQIADLVKNNKPVNKINQGFKGVYKVVSVRQTVQVSPESGVKKVFYQIAGSAFTELNNVIYFNPYVVPREVSDLFYMSTAFKMFFNGDKGRGKNAISLQTYMQILLTIILGYGTSKELKNASEITPNSIFRVNGRLATLMGNPDAVSFRQFYRYFFGIQKFTASNPETESVLNTIPSNAKRDNLTYKCNPEVTGQSIINPEYWNKVTGYSILSQYVNSPINELYAHFRVVPEQGGLIMPCLTFRQTPFSSLKFKKQNPEKAVTPFLTLPRWHLDASVIKAFSTGRDDSFRTNLVQIFGVPQNISGGEKIVVEQTSKKTNIALDRQDIQRSGLKPNAITTHFDFERAGGGWVSFWSKLVGDAAIGSHMKLSGTVECVGIEDDITVGDNLQIGSVVYHIESITHRCSVASNGRRNFVTTISFSQGVDDTTQDKFQVFGETVNSLYADEYQQDVDKGYNLLPSANSENLSNTSSSLDVNTDLETSLPLDNLRGRA